MPRFTLILGLLLATAMAHTALASDPDLITDFNVTNPTADKFTSRGFLNVQTPGEGLIVASAANVPGLRGLGFEAVVFKFGPKSQLDPHLHPRGSELMLVLSGSLDVGFADTANELFATRLHAGDTFVFPKAMVHWSRNNNDEPVSAYSVVSSQNPGTLFVAKALFTAGNTGIPDINLATAFGVDINDVDNLKAAVDVRSNAVIFA